MSDRLATGQGISPSHQDFSLDQLSHPPLKQGVDLLYLYGCDQEEVPTVMRWLSQHPESQLIILEDHPETYQTLLQYPPHPQIRLHFLGQAVEEELKKLIWSHLYLSFGFLASSTKTDRWRKRTEWLYVLLLHLQQGIELTMCQYRDYGVIHAHNLFTNLLNVDKIKDGRSLQGTCRQIPAIICGAGPSLEKQLPLLRSLSHRAIMFGVGSALNPLEEAGIELHFGALLDPEPPPERFLRCRNFHLPIFYQSQLSSTLFTRIHGERICMGENDTYPLHRWFTSQLGIDLLPFEPGWNVLTFALHIAHFLGCDPIIMTGMDGCVLHDQVYTPGAAHFDEHPRTKRVDNFPCLDRFGRKVLSRPDFLMGREWSTSFARDHPETLFVNATEGGLLFEGFKEDSLKSVCSKYLSKSWDLSSYVHSLLEQMHLYPLPPSSVRKKIEELHESIQHVLSLCQTLLDRYRKDFSQPYLPERYALQECELEQEPSYRHIFLPLWKIWQPLLKEEAKKDETHPFGEAIQRVLFLQTLSHSYSDVTKRFLC